MAVRKIYEDTMFYGLQLTDEQKRYVDSIQTKRLTISNSKAGSGKTTIAVGCARILKMPLLYVFNPTEEDEMGFRPGTQEEKEKEYLAPLKDALKAIGEDPETSIMREDLGGPKAFHNSKAWVTAKSHTFTRGTNIKGCFVIIDEAQNWTKAQLKKLLTRIHDDCIVVVIGHTGQCDLDDPSQSGFLDLINHFKDKHYVGVTPLTVNFRGELANDADDM